jgi:hypothetical protein
MQQRTVRKTFKDQLSPTPAQQQALEAVVSRCRTRDNTGLQQRTTAWERRGVAITCSHRQAEVPDLTMEFPDYAEVHSQIL